MKATTLISALVFATAAFAQASQSTSTSVSASSVSAPNTKSSTAGTATNPAPTGGNADISKTLTSSSGNPLIPSTISQGCSDFLTSLNTDKALSTELTTLTNALSAFSGNGGSYSDLDRTLTTLCADKSTSVIGSKLTAFKDSCSEELTGANPDETVIADYDTLYTLAPFKAAMCTRDVDTQTYCLFNQSTSSTPSKRSANIAVTPSTRRKRAQTVLVPKPEAYRSNNLMYLFTLPDMGASALCTSCTKQIMSKFVAFQYAHQHALGIKNSPLLGGQTALYTAFAEQCPAGFATEISNIASVPTTEAINGASPALVGSVFTAVVGALAAAIAIF